MSIFKKLWELMFFSKEERLIRKYNGILYKYKGETYSGGIDDSFKRIKESLDMLGDASKWHVNFELGNLRVSQLHVRHIRISQRSTFDNINGTWYYSGTHLFLPDYWVKMYSCGLMGTREGWVNLSSSIYIYCTIKGKIYRFQLDLKVLYDLNANKLEDFKVAFV